MRRIKILTGVVSVLLMVLPLKVYSVSAVCNLCIVEVQSQGPNSAAEDYVIIANNTDINYDLTGIIIKYWTAGGTANSKTINLAGTLLGHNSQAFVADSLKSSNPNLGVFPSGLALADQGGTLRLLKGGTILDEVSWGVITDSTFAGSVAPVHVKGYSLIRKQNDAGLFLDSGNNSVDFEVSAHACNGLSLNEIQPLLIDGNGGDLVPALEIVKSTGSNIVEDCPILINSSLFSVAAGDLSVDAPVVVIDNVINVSSQEIPLPLNADFSNALQLVPSSNFGKVVLPINTSSVTQPIILVDQTYSKFSSGWKATYAPTLGSSNKLLTTPATMSSNTPSVPPDACSDVLIDEVMPNPVGDDTGNEWLELTTLSDQPAFVGYCGVVINGTQYKFAPDDFISPGQFGVYYDFIDGTSSHTLSLKNTGVSTVSWGRFDNSGTFVALQTFQYQDAPEGDSWARFDDGWRWLAGPTPGLDNSTQQSSASTPVPNEFSAIFDVSSDQTDQPTPSSSSPISITELLPNPASPQTDETDEYVELYNPSDQPVDLTGYKVQTGSSYSYSYTIQNKSIPSGGYLALTSGDTNLSLANSSGQAQLIDSNGVVISHTDPYTDAPEGQAWAYVDKIWQWTSSPTPEAANTLTKPTASSGSNTSSKKSTKSTSKPKKTTKTTVKKPKATKSKNGVVSGSATNDDGTALPGNLHPMVLAGVGVLAVGYAAYEYRHDIANRLYQFRRYRKARRTAGQPATG